MWEIHKGRGITILLKNKGPLSQDDGRELFECRA